MVRCHRGHAPCFYSLRHSNQESSVARDLRGRHPDRFEHEIQIFLYDFIDAHVFLRGGHDRPVDGYIKQ